MAHLRRWHFGVPHRFDEDYQNQRHYGARHTSRGHSRMGQQRHVWIGHFDGNRWKFHTGNGPGYRHANLARVRFSRYKYEQLLSGRKDHEYGHRYAEH